ncbi:MAG: hypothetical protein AAGH64_11110, partial [Planctomycetota bacterium]
PASKQPRVIEFTARCHAYRFVCAPGEEPALMHTVRAMADDPSEPLDWFDAALVAYELARAAQRTGVDATPDTTTNPYQSEH